MPQKNTMKTREILLTKVRTSDEELNMSGDIEDPESIGQGTVVLSVFRDGSLIERRRFETYEEAEAAAEVWADLEGHEFEIDDLSVTHRQGDILEPDVDGPPEDDRRSS